MNVFVNGSDPVLRSVADMMRHKWIATMERRKLSLSLVMVRMIDDHNVQDDESLLEWRFDDAYLWLVSITGDVDMGRLPSKCWAWMVLYMTLLSVLEGIRPILSHSYCRPCP